MIDHTSSSCNCYNPWTIARSTTRICTTTSSSNDSIELGIRQQQQKLNLTLSLRIFVFSHNFSFFLIIFLIFLHYAHDTTMSRNTAQVLASAGYNKKHEQIVLYDNQVFLCVGNFDQSIWDIYVSFLLGFIRCLLCPILVF